VFFFSVAAFLLVGVRPASADSNELFDLTGQYTDGSTVSGTIAIDVATGVITATDLSYGGQTYTDIQTQGAFFGLTESGETPIPVSYGYNVGSSSSTLPQLSFAFPGTTAVDSLIGYNGGTLCALETLCGPDQEGYTWESSFESADGSYLELESGKIVAAPEPSSLLLLGVGLVGMIGFSLKRAVA
jgi:hypothetical protein